MTSELRPAVEVADEIVRALYEPNPTLAAAIIEADREAVRAEQAAEIERLKSAWKAQHKEKVAERAEAKLWFMQAQEAKTELAKWKALAETLADQAAHVALGWSITQPRQDLTASMNELVALVNATRKALTSYKEQRDA